MWIIQLYIIIFQTLLRSWLNIWLDVALHDVKVGVASLHLEDPTSSFAHRVSGGCAPLRTWKPGTARVLFGCGSVLLGFVVALCWAFSHDERTLCNHPGIQQVILCTQLVPQWSTTWISREPPVCDVFPPIFQAAMAKRWFCDRQVPTVLHERYAKKTLGKSSQEGGEETPTSWKKQRVWWPHGRNWEFHTTTGGTLGPLGIAHLPRKTSWSIWTAPGSGERNGFPKQSHDTNGVYMII